MPVPWTDKRHTVLIFDGIGGRLMALASSNHEHNATEQDILPLAIELLWLYRLASQPQFQRISKSGSQKDVGKAEGLRGDLDIHAGMSVS